MGSCRAVHRSPPACCAAPWVPGRAVFHAAVQNCTALATQIRAGTGAAFWAVVCRCTNLQRLHQPWRCCAAGPPHRRRSRHGGAAGGLGSERRGAPRVMDVSPARPSLCIHTHNGHRAFCREGEHQHCRQQAHFVPCTLLLRRGPGAAGCEYADLNEVCAICQVLPGLQVCMAPGRQARRHAAAAGLQARLSSRFILRQSVCLVFTHVNVRVTLAASSFCQPCHATAPRQDGFDSIAPSRKTAFDDILQGAGGHLPVAVLRRR